MDSITQPTIPIAAAFSFLKDTRGLVSWNVRGLTRTLEITLSDAKRVIAILEIQGYIRRTGQEDEWMTTMAGENVSESATPHFVLESVEEALAQKPDSNCQ
jgi:DNA-binding MarR family transcriptional regulator